MKTINKPLNKVANDFFNVDFSEIMLPIIVVTERPSDYPDKYVARLFDTDLPTNVIMIKDTIEEIREGIPKHFFKLMPHVDDDSVIVEIYI
jgi:hypothetical protein